MQTDVFNAFLLNNAEYVGKDEIPRIRTSKLLPQKIIPFSKAITSENYDSWVCFYEDDCKFERLWNNPKRYLPVIKRFSGIISPDYSLYYDMPLAMQKWNIFRNRVLAHWLYTNGVEVIPNIRWGDERTFNLATLGIERHKTIAVGTHGCIKTAEYKKMFIEGFDYIIDKLRPKNIVVYGKMPNKIFCLARMFGINLIQFESEFALSHRREVM